MDIDWDNAPEGATHYDPTDNSESCWMMKMGARVWAFHDTEFWTSIDYSEVAHDIKNYIARPTKPAQEVEWSVEWKDQYTAVISGTPIRTKEQRERDELAEVLGQCVKMRKTFGDMAEELIAAGYRKQERD